MNQSIQQINNFIDQETLDLILSEAENASEESWALFNEKQNGVFWENKRLITNPNNAKLLTDKTNIFFKEEYSVTIANKVQRFFYNDKLGPLADSFFNKKIKYGSVLFLNDVGQISFPQINLTIDAEKNKYVVYPSDIEYQIVCNKKEIMYFITMFYSKNI